MSFAAKFFRSIVVLTTLSSGVVTPLRATAPERWAGLADTVFQHVVQNADLPNAAIPTAFSQDGDGFLWVGTQNGLARWDGFGFRIYKSEIGKQGSLPDNYITTLHTDSQGQLWVGTSSGGFARYDKRSDSFLVDSTQASAVAHVGIVAITDDGNGGLWIAADDSLEHLDAQAQITSHLRHRANDPNSLPFARMLSLLRDREGMLWVGTSNGLVHSSSDLQHFVNVRLPASCSGATGIASLLQDSAGRIWIGTNRCGAYLLETPGSVPHPVLETEPGTSSLATEHVRSILEISPGEIWLGTYGQGIVSVNETTMATLRMMHDPLLPNSLVDDNVWALYRDCEGLIWVGTDRSISRHDSRQVPGRTIFGATSRMKGISDDSVHFVLPMNNGSIWLGLGKNGIDILDPASRRIGELRSNPAYPATALPKSYIDAAVATANQVYLGTPRGFYRAEPLSSRVTRLALPQSGSQTEVWALFIAKSMLWIGGPDGMMQLDLHAKTTHSVRVVKTDHFSDTRIDVIAQAPGDQLWVGTENGLNRLDSSSRVIESILPDAGDSGTLVSGFVNTLLTDRHGRLWVGTVGGISVLVSRDKIGRPRFRRLGTADGLPNDNVDKLLEDHEGRIWASTDNGIAVIDPTTFAVQRLGHSAGIVITSYWVNSGAVTSEGEVLFGGIGGLTVITPKWLKNGTYHPPVVITGIRTGGRLVPSSSFNGGTSNTALTIRPEANSLLVEFSALDYSAPELCSYSYRLDGYDKSWIETDSAHRQAAYTNLPPGDYVLQIRGSNHDGIWTEKTIHVAIHVLPSWYQTLRFEMSVLLAGIAIVVLSVRKHTSRLRHRQRTLEQSVIERTTELQESQRQLEQIAYLDFLTGLPNRRMFTNDFRKLLGRATRYGARFALLLIDLDEFKQTNDICGHDAGDALLIEVGVRLQAVLRESDSVARLGGDEFAILLADDNNPLAVEHVCERIVDSFNTAIHFNDVDLTTNISIGMALFPEDGLTQDDLYKAADLALYQAKRVRGSSFKASDSIVLR